MSIVLSDLRTKVWIIITIVTIVTIIAVEAYASQHTILYHRGRSMRDRLVFLLSEVSIPVR